MVHVPDVAVYAATAEGWDDEDAQAAGLGRVRVSILLLCTLVVCVCYTGDSLT